MDLEKAKAKLRKLLALAQQGVGGEQENAQRMMENMMRKYGLSLSDFSEEDIPSDHEFTYQDQWTKDLYVQIIAKVLNTRKPPIYRYRGASGKTGRTFICACTNVQAAEIKMLHEIYTRQLKKELDLFFTAFLSKHKLFSNNPDEQEEGKKGREFTDEELMTLMGMMGAMDDVTIHKQLGHSRG